MPSSWARTSILGFALALGAACSACAPRAEAPSRAVKAETARKVEPPVGVAAAIVEPTAPTPVVEAPIEWERSWRGFGVSRCAYLRPVNDGDFVGADGGVDVVVHFHAGQMSEREMKASGVRGVFVSCGYGMGTTPYSAAFEDPKRFGRMMKRLMAAIGRSVQRSDVHLRRLALVSWSAGYAAINRILAVPEWYEATDAVVLLDSLHARYVDAEPSAVGRKAKAAPVSARGADQVDVRQLRRFARFASDAVEGKKTMVITHSSIVPPDYASTTEATAALLAEVGVVPTEDPGTEESPRGMSLTVRADAGNLHVRGFRGTGPRDHFDHLYFVGDALRSWLVPRWYTPGGERP